MQLENDADFAVRLKAVHPKQHGLTGFADFSILIDQPAMRVADTGVGHIVLGAIGREAAGDVNATLLNTWNSDVVHRAKRWSNAAILHTRALNFTSQGNKEPAPLRPIVRAAAPAVSSPSRSQQPPAGL